MTTIIAIPGSIRRASFNRRLLSATADELAGAGVTIDTVEAADMDLPIYNGDLQEAKGIPAAAIDLHRRLSTAQGVIIASPEYNGAFSPLLKNTIDWVTRVEMRVFQVADRPARGVAGPTGSGQRDGDAGADAQLHAGHDPRAPLLAAHRR